jgi:hypothetical protein
MGFGLLSNCCFHFMGLELLEVSPFSWNEWPAKDILGCIWTKEMHLDQGNGFGIGLNSSARRSELCPRGFHTLAFFTVAFSFLSVVLHVTFRFPSSKQYIINFSVALKSTSLPLFRKSINPKNFSVYLFFPSFFRSLTRNPEIPVFFKIFPPSFCVICGMLLRTQPSHIREYANPSH